MKGQIKLIKSLFLQACSDGVGGVSQEHVKIAHALTGDDLAEIQKNGDLPSERIVSLGYTPKIIQETLTLVKACLHGPTDEHLRKHGVTVTKINEGMSLVEYQEFDSLDEDVTPQG